MNIYTITMFEGHYPVGSAAVVVAKDKRQAIRRLEASLRKKDLGQKIKAKNLELLDTSKPQVLILCDGNY